ncbi:hypothetical protein L1887_29426 [Cichorium endivia]|nr:hypothetical protein L1887_29426 [Cichorium endivia]
MDFSKTNICQRTRSCYDKLYLEFNEKKANGRHRNSRGGSGGGSISESGEDRINRVGESSGKSGDGLKGSDGRRDEIDVRSRKIRKGRKERKKLGKVSKRGENAKPVCLIVESDDDDDDDDDVRFNESLPGKHNELGIDETSGSGRVEKKSQRGESLERGKNVSRNSLTDEPEEASGHGYNDADNSVESSKRSGRNQSKFEVEGVSGSGKTNKKFENGYAVSSRVSSGENRGFGENLDNKSARPNDSPHNSDDDDALSLLGDNDGSGKGEKKSEKGFLSDITASNADCLKGKRGFEPDESDDHERITLGDDITCLDDYDPSHSSRVGSNEVKLSPVDLDSIQADGNEGDDFQELKSSEEDNNDWQDLNPSVNPAAANVGKDVEVISLSSSSDDDDDDEDDDDDDDDDTGVLEADNIVDTGDGFWTEVVKKGPLNGPVSKKRRTDTDTSLTKPNLKKQQRIQGDIEEPQWVADYKGWEKSTQNVEKNTVKKPHGNVIDVIRILTETIKVGQNGDELLKQYVTPSEDSPIEDNPSQETSVETLLSYKFKFEDEEIIKSDESESDKEVDGLFDEMNMCFQLSEIGSSGASVVNNSDTGFFMENIDQATLCRIGKHTLTLNDQFGIICRYCSYVEIEVRDILPPLSKNGRGGHIRHDTDPDKPENLNFSGLHFADNHRDSKESEYEKGTVWDLVPGVKETMYPHQREGFEFIWKKIAGGTYIEKLEKRLPNGGSGCIISHAPGTGKSRLTIVFLLSFMRMYPDSRPLIIAPRCMLLTWEEEFKKWEADVPFYNLNNKEYSGQEDGMASTLLKQNGNGKSARCLRLVKLYSWKRKSSVLGITYRLFESLAGEEGKKKKNSAVKNLEDVEIKKILLQVPTLLVLDEGHTPRNEESLVWKALLNVKTKRSIILSGTPFQNNFNELYNTFCLVNPLLPFDITSLKNDDFTIKRGRKNNSAKGQWDSITSEVLKSRNKLDELKAMIDPFVHVHKGTILQEKLPGLRDALVVLKPTKTQKTLLGMISGTKSQVENDHIMSLVSIHPSLVQENFINEGFYKVLKMYENDPRAGGKTNFLMELIKLSCALNERVLVFSQYTKPLKFLMELLESKFHWVRDKEYLYMDGQQEERNRQTSINTLNDPKSEVKILLASIRACSEGINLVGASRVVLLDVQWNPSVERQAISRAYRLGQKKLVYVYHLVTGTMEGEKYIRQVEKSHLSELVFSSKHGKSLKNKLASMVSGDKILEEMVQHDKLQHMFEKVIYQPKESDLVKTFG